MIDNVLLFMILSYFAKPKVRTCIREILNFLRRVSFSRLKILSCSGCFFPSLTNNFDCDISLIFSNWILKYNSVNSLILLFCPFNDEDAMVLMHLHTDSAFRFKQELWAVKGTDKIIASCARDSLMSL